VALKRLKWLMSKPYVGVVVELAGLVGGREQQIGGSLVPSYALETPG
jgi:hypothetical protein